MDSLDKIAEEIGTVVEEQADTNTDREMTENLPRRDLDEYDGRYDTETTYD
jgi:hypothetical protein